MNVVSCVASLVSLTAITHAGLDVSLIATWDSIDAGLYVGSESIEYNADDNLWYFGNWYESNDTDKVGEIGSLSGSYPVSSDDFDLQEDIMDVTAELPSGMLYTDGSLYIGDFSAGGVHKFNTSTNTYSGFADFGGMFVNGICLDFDTGLIYATSTGWDFTTFTNIPAFSGLFSIDPDTLTVTRLYDASNMTAGLPTFDEGFVFNPNGCWVKDGVVYMVDVQLVQAGNLGMYDIATGSLTRDANVLATHSVCDGIVYVEPYWFVTDNFQGQLLALDTTDEDAIFEVVLTGLPSAADISLGPDNTIGIPSTDGIFYFAQFDITSDTTDEPTSEPTTEPTAEPSSAPTVNESSATRMCVATALAVIGASLF